MLTFTDDFIDREIKIDHYRKAVDYFCNIPTLVVPRHCFFLCSVSRTQTIILFISNTTLLNCSELEKQIGFSILIDKRNDKWSSIKNILLLLQDYFPAKLNHIYILRPQSYLQRVLFSVFFQEEAFRSLESSHPTVSTKKSSTCSDSSQHTKELNTAKQQQPKNSNV